jgi:hypothetical protein
MSQEIDFYLTHLDHVRQAVRDVLLGLTADGLNWKPLPAGTNSVYNLAQHVAWVEQWVIGHELGERPFPHDWSQGQDLAGSGEDAADLLFWLDEAATTTGTVLASLERGALDGTHTKDEAGVEVIRPIRWFIVDIIEHYAEHLGQMRLTRQLWEAQTP